MSDVKTLCRGELVIPEFEQVSMAYSRVLAELDECGLDQNLLRELHPRYAFARACHEMEEGRIIRRLDDGKDELTFQFTHETREGGLYDYQLEAVVTLDKKDGTISCPLPELAKLAQEKINHCRAVRDTSDMTRLVRRLFREAKIDLFSVRRAGGVYFVSDTAGGKIFLGKVQRFVGKMGGKFQRYAIAAEQGTAAYGDLRESIKNGLDDMVSKHAAAVDKYVADTRVSALEVRLADLRETRLKVEGYALYLQDEGKALQEDLAELDRRLREKIESATAAAAAA